MPKPGRNNNNFERGGGDYRGGNNTRRVTFKPNRHRDKNDKNNKDWGHSLRAHLEEDDVDMSFGTNGYNKNFSKKNFKKKGSGSGSTVPNVKRKLPIAIWYRITIPYGNKYDKNYILQTLLSNLNPLPFNPLCWSVNGTTATFYVDDHKVADKLHNLDREIQYPDGFKMIIKVNTGSPTITVTPEIKEKIKVVMGKRYNAAVKALDLSRFHLDPELRDTFCALAKPQILLAVMEIIAKNIPELEALDISHNHLQIFAFLKNMKQDFKNLKILHMGNNKIADIVKLDQLIGLPVLELVLDGNPLCDRYTEQVKYISEVRKRFPKVLKLDGIDLPPPIGFDIEDEIHLPSSQQTFLCTQDGQGIVRQFLEQYFVIFDSDNRQPLIHAYHENVFFSMTMAYPYGQKQNSAWLDWYATNNRNLQRVLNTERRRSLLKQGQVSVVSFLSDMPKTKHDLQSFTVDLTLFTPQMLTLIVSGMFKELRTAHKAPPIRHFFRSFVIIPAGSGFCIINEQLHVTNATEEQTKNAFKIPIPAPAVANVAAESSKLTTNSTNVPDEQVKQQMIQALAQQSGMNVEWSQKCLQETEWDFPRATLVFTELQKQGVIPPEAFVH